MFNEYDTVLPKIIAMAEEVIGSHMEVVSGEHRLYLKKAGKSTPITGLINITIYTIGSKPSPCYLPLAAALQASFLP